MKVNMTPNPLDVVTIHASQGDTEARQWEFELHNNGELIDTSDVKEQLVFKAYKGGTEQLLPENTSTPTTSPFKGDIRYPQGLLTDQEFTYRQSPTEEDGLAKITDIKGNTLVWNQLVETLIATQDYEGVTFTNNGDGSLTINGTTTNTSVKHPSIVANNVGADGWKASHRYYIELNNTSLQPLLVRWGTSTESAFAFARRNTEDSNSTRYLINGANIGSPLGDGVGGLRFRWNANVGLTFNNAKIIPQIFDLTEMFGTEKAEEIYQMEVNEVGSGVAYFRSLFPISYYSYNQGSLLSFNGNGIKTVGKNIFNVDDVEIGTAWNGTSNSARARLIVPLIKGKTYSFKINGTNNLDWLYAIQTDVIPPSVAGGTISSSFTATNNYLSIGFNKTNISKADIEQLKAQLEIGTSTSYEPYTSSTLSLPISTYFPTGMKSAGNAYDELTPNKAITRVGMVDLGSLTYVKEAPSTAHPDWPLFYASVPGALGRYGAYGNTQICAKYSNRASSTWQDKTIGFGAASTNINIADTAFADYTVDQVKQALSGVMLYYKLATPTEASFSTASLVTENAEIPLSNDDGILIGRCTEQLSENPGFFDAKIKLSDADGECYSNKLQLHVERSPQ